MILIGTGQPEMKRLLFVDHAFHKRTRSSDFFTQILSEEYEVEIYYLDPEEEPDDGVVAAARQADIVVCWQLDFLAPLFRSLGKPVIVIPMFDGSGGMPDLHWIFASGARFFNFSIALNERIRMLGAETMQLRYFPPPAPKKELPTFTSLNAFFWQRRPDHGIDHRLVDGMIGNDIDALHLHNVPDVPVSVKPLVEREGAYRFTESSWFETKAAYEACLASANVFIAPRVAEGIGMALLEAMARGMVVLAHDAPTNNEYISNWVTGILFNKDSPSKAINLRSQAPRLSRTAWASVVEGHARWQDQRAAILDWVRTAPAGREIDMDHVAFYRDLWRSYHGSIESYETFLKRHLGLLERIADLPFGQFLDLVGRPQAIAPSAPAFRLSDDGLLPLTAATNSFTGEGWSDAEPEFRWVIGRTAKLRLPKVQAAGERIQVTFLASPLPQLGSVKCTVDLKNRPLFSTRLKPGWKEYSFTIDTDVLDGEESEFTLRFDKAAMPPGDTRELSVCFKWFRFTPAPNASADHGTLRRWLGR